MKKCFLISGLVLAASGVLGMNDPTECKHGLIKLTLGAKVKPVMFDDPIYYEPITLGKSSSKGTKMGPLTEFDSKFFKAVKENDIETVKKFLEVGVEEINNIVSRSNNSEALKKNLNRRLWIRIKTNVNAQDEKGNTPLIWAIRNGNYEIVKMLLDNGDIDLKLKDNYGNTAQDWIEMKGYVDILNSGEGGLSRTGLREILQENVRRLIEIRYGPVDMDFSVEDIGLDVDGMFAWWDFMLTKNTRLVGYTRIICKVMGRSDEEEQKMLDRVEKLVNQYGESTNELKSSKTYADGLVREWFNSVNSSK